MQQGIRWYNLIGWTSNNNITKELKLIVSIFIVYICVVDSYKANHSKYQNIARFVRYFSNSANVLSSLSYEHKITVNVSVCVD